MSRKRKSKDEAPPERIEVTPDELHGIVERTRKSLSEDDYTKLEAVIETYLWLVTSIESMRMKLTDLRQRLFGKKTERGSDLLDKEKDKKGKGDKKDKGNGAADSAEKPKGKGHGRNSASAYTGARKHTCQHETLKAGDRCPECDGRLYEMPPSVLVTLTGQAPVIADRYEMQRLRCSTCAEVFKATPPAEADRVKYNETCASIIALLKYGSGLPFNRIERLQRDFGIPLPASTQWDVLLKAVVLVFAIVYAELIRQVGQCSVVYNDDTGARILSHGPRTRGELEDDPSPGCAPRGRTGTNTTGIVGEGLMGKVALYFTGWRHAGENLETVLRERPEDLGPPIQMCDGLDRNVPGAIETILGNCLTHGRRHFVKNLENFPRECRFVILAIARVYRVDAQAREDGLTAEARLQLHQQKSALVMQRLEKWMRLKLDMKKVEPNSPLGQALRYCLKRWEKLTVFLRVAGAPLDSNIVERALKKVVLHRKSSLFYKTDRGAQVGDICMSLIYTCELHHENPFEYLNELQRNAELVQKTPSEWLPWNYRATLEELASKRSSSRRTA